MYQSISRRPVTVKTQILRPVRMGFRLNKRIWNRLLYECFGFLLRYNSSKGPYFSIIHQQKLYNLTC